MYPTSSIVATVSADRLRRARAAREARAARHLPSMPSRTARAAMTQLALVATGGRGKDAIADLAPRCQQQTLFDYGPFTAAFNVSGHPAISLPLVQSASGLPIGVQIVAPSAREDLLFRVAAQLEQAMPWKHRTPGYHVGHPPT